MNNSYKLPMRIASIKKKFDKVIVYNFSVKDDESYVVNGVISHNCRCSLAPASKDLEYKPEFTEEDFNQWLNS